MNTAEDLLLPATQLCRVNGGKYVFDLNQDGICTSTDRDFLKDWLYGWEDNQTPNPTGVHRSWPMGGVNLSTPAVVGPPTFPSWYYTTTSDEQIAFQNRFVSGVLNGSPLSARGTYGYVNTSSGVLHAFNAGQYTPATSDPCLGQTSVTLYRGSFRPSGACVNPPGITPRNYGTGGERFAFLPRQPPRAVREQLRGADHHRRSVGLARCLARGGRRGSGRARPRARSPGPSAARWGRAPRPCWSPARVAARAACSPWTSPSPTSTPTRSSSGSST